MIDNINIIPGQLGKQIERTFSRTCYGHRDVFKVSVFYFSILINSLLTVI